MGQHYVGLDVSLETTSVCVLDEAGVIVWRGKVGSTPEALANAIHTRAPQVARIGLETGPLCTWHWHALRALGLPVICLDARHAKAALSVQMNKMVLLLGAEIAERCRQAVGAMLAGHATEAPEGVLQPFRQGREALAAQHDLGMLPAAARQAKMVEPMRECLAGDGDAELAGVDEVGQAHTARRMILRKEHLLIRPVAGPPGAHTPLQGPPDTIRNPLDTEAGLQLLEQGNRT